MLARDIYDGNFTDPNGNLTPFDLTKPALYRKRGGLVYLWAWDTTLQLWLAVITP